MFDITAFEHHVAPRSVAFVLAVSECAGDAQEIEALQRRAACLVDDELQRRQDAQARPWGDCDVRRILEQMPDLPMWAAS